MSTARRLWLYGVTSIGLIMLASGVGSLLTTVLDLAIAGAPRVEAGLVQRELSLGLALLLIGAPLWFFPWRTVQRSVARSPFEVGSALRKLFLNAIVTVTAIMLLVNGSELLTWLLGGAQRELFSPGGLALLIVAGAVWYFHWLTSEGEGHPSPAARTLRRWYVYILSGWGLVWLASGLVLSINSALLALPVWGQTIVSDGLWTLTLRMSITWVLLGALAWAFHWFRMSTGDVDSTLRQVYLYLLAIVGSGVAGLASVSFIVDRILFLAFGGASPLDGSYFQFLAWTVPLAMVSAAIWLYHRQMAREEAELARERRLSARRVHFYIMSMIGLTAMIAGLNVIGVLIDIAIDAASSGTVVTEGWWRGQLSTGVALLLVSVPLWLYYWSRVIAITESGGIQEWRARSRRVYLYAIIFAAIAAVAAGLVNIVFQLLSWLLTGSGSEVLRNSKWSLQSLVVAVPVLVYHWQTARQDQRRGAEAAAVHKVVTVMVSRQAADLVPELEAKLGFRVRVLYCPSVEASITEADLDALVSQIVSAPGHKVMVLACGPSPQVMAYEEK